MSDMSEKNGKVNTVRNQIDEIREIILGDDRVKFESEIAELRKENDDLRTELKTLKSRLEKSNIMLSANVEDLTRVVDENKLLVKDLETLKKDFEAKISRLNEKKLDKTEIGQAFIEWGTRVKDAKS